MIFQVIGFLAALLGKQGSRVDVMRQRPQFIRKVRRNNVFDTNNFFDFLSRKRRKKNRIQFGSSL